MSKTILRRLRPSIRRLLTASLGIVLALSALRASSCQEYGASEIASGTALTVIPSSSPAFDRLIARSYPGLSDLPGFAAAKPYMILVRNDAPQAILAFSVHFLYGQRAEFPPSGDYATFLYDPESDTPLLDQNGEKLAPGAMRLIAPGYLMESPDLYLRTVGNNRWSMSKIPSAVLDPTHGETTPYTDVQVDAVVFANQHMRGANQTRLFERYDARRQARHDEQVKVQQNLGDLGARKTLSTTLGEHRKSAFHVWQNPTQDNDEFYRQQYALALGLEAGRLQRVANSRGLPTLKRHLQSRLQQPLESLVREN